MRTPRSTETQTYSGHVAIYPQETAQTGAGSCQANQTGTLCRGQRPIIMVKRCCFVARKGKLVKKNCGKVQWPRESNKWHASCSPFHKIIWYINPWMHQPVTTRPTVKVLDSSLNIEPTLGQSSGSNTSNCHVLRRFPEALCFYTAALSYFMLRNINYRSIGTARLFLNMWKGSAESK